MKKVKKSDFIQHNRIKELREAQKLSQGELGKLMDLDNTTISRHESNSRSLAPEDIAKYAKIFKCETWELFMHPDELRPPSAKTA